MTVMVGAYLHLNHVVLVFDLVHLLRKGLLECADSRGLRQLRQPKVSVVEQVPVLLG